MIGILGHVVTPGMPIIVHRSRHAPALRARLCILVEFRRIALCRLIFFEESD